MINKKKLNILPDKSGVYIMKDNTGKIIYIGKAKNIKKRVLSYFTKNHDSAKTTTLVETIDDIEYIATVTESEALLLEANLIKKYTPKFNIQLKDSKKYPFLCVSVNEDFPRVFKTRNTEKKEMRYFGPYTSVGTITHTIKLLHRLFPIRYCNKKLSEGKKNGKVCFYYHINRCKGPCELKINAEDYRRFIDNSLLFLEGEHKELISKLKNEMNNLSKNLEFEKAAVIRDQLFAINEAAKPQGIHRIHINNEMSNIDVINFCEESGIAAFSVLQVRNGKLQGQKLFLEKQADIKPHLFSQFIELYTAEQKLPRTLLVSQNNDLIETDSVKIITAKSIHTDSAMKNLLDNAYTNARLALNEELSIRLYSDGLTQLQTLLKLPALPYSIEGFDIANLQGSENVAGMVSFKEGKPDKKNYRHFIIKSFAGQNDFASIQEAVTRRYQRLINENLPMPDLILIDGGKGQLSSAKSALDALGKSAQPLISLAKKEELIFTTFSKEPVKLNKNNFALRILQSVRDESHRYVNAFHKKRRGKITKKSILDSIPGIGTETRKKLLKHYGSLQRIKGAGLSEIERVVGNKKKAKIVFNFISRKSPG